MPLYRFTGDSPRSLPEYGIEVVSPGEIVDTGEQVLEHPDFKEKKSPASKAAEKAADPSTGASEAIVQG